MYITQASDEGRDGDPEQLQELQGAAGWLDERATAGCAPAGGAPGRPQDSAVHAAIENQVSFVASSRFFCCWSVVLGLEKGKGWWWLSISKTSFLLYKFW